MAAETPDLAWQSVPQEIRDSITSAWRNDVPPVATALYGRWWQLETWLRSLVYVELKAAFGPRWVEHLPKHSEKRQQGEQVFQYMATPDALGRLAYADATSLLEIIEAHWDLFEPTLLEKTVWVGRTVELRNIRNRIGHCRRPHTDDLLRLEQTLRDLEGGAFRAVAAFNRQWEANEAWNDAVVDGWTRGNHKVAMRLLEHARRQYETAFELRWSRRPWCERNVQTQDISGTPGYLWHAAWSFMGRPLDLGRFWNDHALNAHRDLVLFVCSTGSNSLEVSFSALEDPHAIADAIGACFDAALSCLRRGPRPDETYEHWVQLNSNLDPRVQAGGPWSIVDDSTTPITLFSAQTPSPRA